MLTSRLVTQVLVLIAALAVPVQSSPVQGLTSPFDGQYIKPNSSNSAVEWWWGQAIAEPVGNNPPAAFQFLFYQGYPVQIGPRDALLPEYYIVLNGFFANGTAFAATIPATSGDVTNSGQEVTGNWAGAGSFKGSKDLSTFDVKIDAPSVGIKGSLKLKSNAGHHYGCNSTSDPYFSSVLPSGASLNDAEKVLFTQLGWATSVPGAVADVNMKINGTKLKFKGQGYHDANWAPTPLNAAVSTWYFGSATVGEYDLSYTSVTPVNSTKILSTGYLSRNGVILQNQCGLLGAKQTDSSAVTPYGLQNDTVAGGVSVPTGYLIDYVLANGEKFQFNLSSIAGAQNPDSIAYHRWVGRATGGKVGDEPSSGLTVFEWLNPGLVVYSG